MHVFVVLRKRWVPRETRGRNKGRPSPSCFRLREKARKRGLIGLTTGVMSVEECDNRRDGPRTHEANAETCYAVRDAGPLVAAVCCNIWVTSVARDATLGGRSSRWRRQGGRDEDELQDTSPWLASFLFCAVRMSLMSPSCSKAPETVPRVL